MRIVGEKNESRSHPGLIAADSFVRLAHVTQPRMTQIMNLLHLTPDNPEEQAVLALIMDLHHSGVSSRKIIKELVQRGIKPKNGGSWHPKVVLEICARDGAAGGVTNRGGLTFGNRVARASDSTVPAASQAPGA